MFVADPANPVTWWTYIATILIAVCIYLICRQRNDILSVIGFKNKSSNDTSSIDSKPMENIPILTTNDYNLIYTQSAIHGASKRINNLILLFSKKFVGQQPDFMICSPGRANLIGQHIEYYGYNVLSMAIEKNILFAVKIMDTKQQQNIIQLCNKQSSIFSPIEIDLSSKQDTNIQINAVNHHWSIYFIAAYHVICDKYSDKIKQFKSLKIMIDGNIPKQCGLSSSTAFICGAVVCLLFANLDELDFRSLTKSEIIELCIECGRKIGINSDGMNEIMCIMSNKGYGKYIEFIPDLKGFNIKLPSNNKVRWVISNCLKENKLENDINNDTQNHNIRVIECRLAAVLLAKLLKLRQWRQVLTLRDIQNITKMELDELLFQTMDLLNNEPYSIEQIEDELECDILGITLEDLMVGIKKGKIGINKLRKLEGKYRLPLQQRALHIYSEANRVLNFKNICIENYNEQEFEYEIEEEKDMKIIKKLGKLMSDSHISCRDKYQCSCDELDELQSLCIDGGALGAKLTGNGWNGSVISLVEVDKLNKFKSYLNKNYYASIPKIPLNHQFTTSPSIGLTLFKIVNDT